MLRDNRKKQFPFFSAVSLVLLLALFPACSSAPKKPTEIFSDRNMAAKQLNLANQTAGRGLFEDALLILQDARRLALTTDDPSLRIKTSMSRGNIYFSMGRQTEAFQDWESAAAEGDDSGEYVLAALARIYTIRGRLVLLSLEDEKDDNKEQAVQELTSRLLEEMKIVKSDPPSMAVGYVTLGLSGKILGHWAEAEDTVKKALSIHEKNLNLEDAAYDWFLIASIRSVSGNHDTALEALNLAISFDRRAENGFGLASNWQARGDVYQKAGRTEESRKAYRRAVEIYRALGLNDRADKLEAGQ